MEFAELIKTTKVDDVVLSCPGLQTIRGTLAITSHHLLFSSQAKGEQRRTELWLLIRNVDAIEKRLANPSGTITLKCKDLKILQLDIPGMEECLNIANSIEALSSLESVMMTYPFFYRPQNTTLGTGWLTHITEQYYKQIATDTGAWRLSSINADFGVCPSYPPLVIVPARLNDEALQKSARFRQGRRFPVLSYYHKKNGTAMLRSSQPLVGPNRKRCHEDELLLAAVLEGGERGFILDTRSLQAAKQARVMGGGLEHRSCYHGWKRLHRALERGRSLQESFIKLVEACNDLSPHMDRWLSRLEASKWLSHVKEALNAACLAAQCLEREEACVLVHGAEGKDATLLVTALVQVILDPACRTLVGFQGLLEREWIQAGHPFQLRCAHSAYAHTRLKQEAPTFLLFLDCVWQLGRQFPFSLAFNEHLLLALFEHCYASPYSTFLGNNEKERQLCEMREKTHCLWPWINHVEKFLNPLYMYNPLAIWPSVEPQSLVLWQGHCNCCKYMPVAKHPNHDYVTPGIQNRIMIMWLQSHNIRLFLRWVHSCHHLDEAWAEIQQIATSSQT